MEKIIKSDRTAVITLDGTECKLTFPKKYRGFDIENRSGGDILVSLYSGKAKGDDGTMTILAGRSFNFMQMYESDTIYLTGTGEVAVAAKNDSSPNFKAARGGGVENGGEINGTLKNNANTAFVSGNADSTKFTFPLKSVNADGSALFNIATSHTDDQNGLLIQVKSPDGATMAYLNIYAANDGSVAVRTNGSITKAEAALAYE